MANRRKKINGKWIYLPKGVHVVKNGAYFRVRDEEGKERYFPTDDEESLKQASALAASQQREKREYGQRFGTLSDEEKRAVELWRAYRKECWREGCKCESIGEVMARAIAMVRPRAISIPFPELATDYLRAMAEKNLSDEHLRKRSAMVKRFCGHFQNMRAGNITPDDVRAYLATLKGRDGKKASPRTIQDNMVALGHIFKHGVKLGRVEKNPVAALDKPQVRAEREPATITTEDAKKILDYLTSRDGAKDLSGLCGLVLAMFCGVRPAELARMRFADLFPAGREEAYLSRAITKTSVDRRARLRANVVAWLDFAKALGLYGAPDAFILQGGTEKQRCEKYTGLLRRIQKKAGVVIPHDALRHTAATMMCALDGMAETAEELGHDVRTLQRYYRHAVPREEAMAFFSIFPPL